jgi:hypothetical protein
MGSADAEIDRLVEPVAAVLEQHVLPAMLRSAAPYSTVGTSAERTMTKRSPAGCCR